VRVAKASAEPAGSTTAPIPQISTTASHLLRLCNFELRDTRVHDINWEVSFGDSAFVIRMNETRESFGS